MKKFLIFDRFEPEVEFEVSVTPREERELRSSDYITLDVTNFKGMYLVIHNDEYTDAIKTDGETVEEVKENLLEEIRNLFLLGYGTTIEKPSRVIGLDIYVEDINETTPEDVVKDIFDSIDDSCVNGDSSSVMFFATFDPSYPGTPFSEL